MGDAEDRGAKGEEQPLLPPALRPLPTWPTVLALAATYALICGFLSFGFGVWSLVACFGLVALLMMLVGEPVKEQHPAAAWLVLLGFMVVGTAMALGISNYNANYAQYVNAFSGRHYVNVTAKDPAIALMDASRITFTHASPDASRGLGWKGTSATYCVAPVISLEDKVEKTSNLTVQYWAVGVDCCTDRGTFHCDDAEVRGSRESSVIREDVSGFGAVFLTPSSRRDTYDEAVAAAAAIYKLHAPAPRMLVRWTASGDSVTSQNVVKAVCIWAVSTVVVAALVYLTWVRVQAYYDTQVRKAWAAYQSGAHGRSAEGKPAWL
mmetsp:Transcript_60907/g.113028  ORF Transcript_60907/g.113028 Transcript_60907/m.113028 type:complete len:322 (+) Transcript_60907:98-1063(+)